jgi:gamma-glutamyltranspeptidase/glutathione hydrolase
MIKNILILIMIFSFVLASFPDAIGKNGAVSSSSSHASQVGIDVLKNGGNAIDAAIAVGFSLSVTFPNAGNLGGGGFMVIRTASGDITTIDFREVAPKSAHRDMYLDANGDVIPGMSLYTTHSAGVPGTVAGFGYAHEKYGTKSWNYLIRPAIKLASNGFKLSYRDAMYLNGSRSYFLRDKEAAKIFAGKDIYSLGDLFIQRDLARTLRRISVGGAEEFYTGVTADMIQSCMTRTGGIITKQDLSSYRAIERAPIEFDYRGYSFYSMPPASSGGICLAEILNQIETINFDSIGYHSTEHIQPLVEAERRAYSDRAEYIGDIDFVDVPVSILTSDSYARDRFSDYNPSSIISSSEMGPGNLINFYESDETTHYSVVDKWGNAVSVTITLNGKYGNGIVVDGAGFLLNNEMDDFSIKPGHPNKYGLVGKEANAVAPFKRMLSSMTPTIVEDADGSLVLVLGSPGGSTIITTVAQIAINVIDFGMNIQDAVDSPRFHHQWLPDVIFYESNRFPVETLDKLYKTGYEVSEKRSIGEANCIQITPSGIKFAAADSRRAASALAY